MPPARRIEWLTAKIEAHPPRKVIPSDLILHAQRVNTAHKTISEQLEKEARIAERTEEIVKTIEWSDQSKLEKITSRFLDRKRHRKRSWLRPMMTSGLKHAKRALAARNKSTAP